MKVAVISHSCVVPVNQQVYVDLNALSDVEVALIVPQEWKSEYDGSMFRATNLPSVTFPVYPSPVAGIPNVALHFYKRLPIAELRRWGADVVLASQEPYSLSGYQSMWMARRLGVPFVFQTNQNIVKRYPPPFSWMERQVYARAAGAMAYSEEARQVMIGKGRTGASHVVPYATDVRLFRSRFQDPELQAAVAALRERIGIPSTVKTVVGYLGRLVPEKGLDTLLKAVAQLPDRESVAVMIVGSGAEQEQLKSQAEQLGLAAQVFFTGGVPHDQAPLYMAALDIFVLPSRTTPSWKEQFGRVIIEALACEAPVVGSDSGQIPHLIRDTQGGLVFKEGDAADLARCLQELIDDPAKRMQIAQAGKRSVDARYTSEAVARQLRDVLLEATTRAA